MNEEATPASPPPASEDARALLMRLYREIGIAAVAAALQVPAREPTHRRPSVDDIPAVLRGEDKVAA
jgi:hypothetical protein